MCRIEKREDTNHELIKFLVSLETRRRYFNHPLNQLLDTLCQHEHRVYHQGHSRGDPSPYLSCTICGHQQFV